MKKLKLLSISFLLIGGLLNLTFQPKVALAEQITYWEHEGECDCKDGSPGGDGYVCLDVTAETECTRDENNKVVPSDQHCYKDGHRGDSNYYCDDENPI